MTVRDASAEVLSTSALRADRGSARRGNAASRFLIYLLLGMVVISIVRIVSDQQRLTTGGALGAAINSAIPILLAGLGGLWSERAGVVNIGLEGQMVFGTYFAAYFAYQSGSPWMLLVGGIVGGLIGGLVHAVATVIFGVDQIISGVAIYLLAIGVTKYLAGIYFNSLSAQAAGGGPTQSPKVHSFSTLEWHSAGRSLDTLNGHHWFFVSDVAGLLEGIVTSLDLFTIIALLLVPLTWVILWRTSFGLRLRACGENPTAAETMAVKVYRMKFIAVLVSGTLAGLAGAFLVDYSGLYQENQTGGRGYIGLAAMIFGNWRPGGLLAGASLFGYTDGLQAQTDGQTVHALLLFIAIVLALLAAFQVVRARRRAAMIAAAAAVLVLVWYLTTSSIPPEFAKVSPQVITLLVLAAASQRLRMPAADGIPWRRGQGA